MKRFILILLAVMVLGVTSYAQNRTYRGVVVDASNGEPLVGVSIMPLGEGNGTATDIDGKFTLSLPSSVKQIKVSYVGMKTEIFNLSQNMKISLTALDTSLDDVVVLGYGSAKKLGSVVGSVSVVGEKTLENTTTATFVDALQGQVAGLSVLSNSGDPSSTDNAIRIRGINSINAGTTPLFILDGAPVDSSIFTTLNPNDIQSITVLKDAASVAIYGSRAANGVIVITSKRGQANQKARFTIRANFGWSQMVGDNVQMMNSEQYIEFRDKINNPVSAEIKNLVNKYGISTDWRKETFDSSAPTYSINASLSGGGERLNYFLSVNHYDASGIISQSGMRRETLRSSITASVTDWFRVGLQTNLGYTKYKQNGTVTSSAVYVNNPMVFTRMAFPYDSPRYYTIDDNGQIHYGEKALYLHYSRKQSPDFYVQNRNTDRNRVTANVTLFEQITPLKGLILRAQQNLDAFEYRLNNVTFPYESYLTPMGDKLGAAAVGKINTGANQQSFRRYTSFTYTNTGEYNFQIGEKNDFTFLVGQESIITRSNQFQAQTTGQSDKRMNLLQQGTAATVPNQTQTISNTTFNSLFFKLNYSFDERYFFEASYRRDGSSKFAKNHRWANFYSVGAMWNVRNEKFLEDNEWLNALNLRLSYGTTGNSSIDNYLYYGAVSTYGPGYGTGEDITSTYLSSPGNKNLTWETVKSFDLGLHAKMLNRFTAEIDFYKKTTDDMLMSIPWSYTTGFSSGWGNIGSMTNTGVDVNVLADVVKTKDWYWGLRCNFSYNRNKITKLFNGRDSFTVPGEGIQYKVGHDAGEFFTVRYIGVDPQDGKQQWLDKNGNITKTFNEDEDAILTGKSQFAPWNGGFGTTIRWKGLSLQGDFTWAAKKYMINNDAYFLRNAGQGAGINQDVEMLKVWTKPGDVTMYPNATETIQFDSRQVEDASFLRMKTLTLSYALPKTLIKQISMSNLAFHFTARNLFTITKFGGYDPEPQTNVFLFNYPNTRQFEVGLEATF